MGFVAQIEHDDRYDLADECPQLVYALWEAVGAIAAAHTGAVPGSASTAQCSGRAVLVIDDLRREHPHADRQQEQSPTAPRVWIW
jgi:hypothetical protein